MLFMPFQILGVWLRGLLSLVLLGGGIFLLLQWHQNREQREVYVTDKESVRPNARPEDGERPPAAREERVRVVPWHFGWNRATAYLLGGAALLIWSLGGGWLAPRLIRRRGSDKPGEDRTSTPHRLKRPDGTEIQVEMYGPPEAAPVVLIHGWGLDSGEWYYAKRRQLVNHHRLIVWDLPGLGMSSGPRDKDWSLEKLAGDLEAVLTLAGDRPAVLVGHSIGGMIILTFCRLFPEALGTRVSGLVLAHTTYTNPVKTTSKPGLYTALQKPILEPMCHLMIWLAPLFWLMNWLSYLNGSAHRSTERTSFSGRETRQQLDFMAWFTVTAWPAVLARGFLAMFRYDASAVLGTISVPTLVVAGDQDGTCTPEASAFMARSIPGAQLITLGPARHGGLFEHHDKFDAAVEPFLARCTASTDVLAHS